MASKHRKKSSAKGSRKGSKKGCGGTFFFLLFIVVLCLAVFYHREIYQAIKPYLEKKPAVEEKKDVLLYFSDSEEEYLMGEKRAILKKKDVRQEAEELVQELIKGPQGELIPTLPPTTKLLALRIDKQGVARVDFSQEIAKDHPGGSTAEIMTVYSIVNSLTSNFPKIKRVQIFIDGRPAETLAGHLSLEQTLSSKMDLIKAP